MSWIDGAIDDDAPSVDAYFSMVERVHMRPSVGRGMIGGGLEYASGRSESL